MKIRNLLLIFLLAGCHVNNGTSSSLKDSEISLSTSMISESITTSNITTSSSSETVISSTSEANSSMISTSSSSNEISSSSSVSSSITSTRDTSENSISSSTSSEVNICEEKPGGKNEDGSDKLPIPCNKNNKIKIGNDNASMTSFDFTYSLPDYFRAIYGNNFNTGNSLFYANGGYQIKMGGPNTPTRGIQTAMFESNLKLEIRINIGDMFNNSKGNDVDKDLPVMVIYAFNEDGKYLRKVEIDTITKNNENSTIKKYMNGEDVAYLEIRALQCAYKSSQGYNYALLGLDLIAWPYEYN